MADWEDMFDGEAGRQHSRFAPSSLKRILTCPRSVALSESIGATSGRASVYAAEGSVAHMVAEAYLRGVVDHAKIGLGTKHVVDGHTITVDADMLRYGKEYADYVHALMVPGDELFVETTVKLDTIVGEKAGMYGHLDAAVWSPSRGLLLVIDYKYGRGIRVVALDNPQLKAYGLGALYSIPSIDPDDVKLVSTHVFQPRVPGQSAPDTIPTVDLLRWGYEEVEPVLSEIMTDGAINRPFVTGDHCRFCPALAQCPAMRSRATQAAQKAFGAAPVPANALSDQEVADCIAEAEIIGPWLEAVQKEGLARALRGTTIPGHKVVQTRGRRVWVDEEAIANQLRDLGLTPAQIFDMSPRSPAQVEKDVAAEKREAFKNLWTTKSSGHSLAPVSDPRPGVRVGTAADVFRNAPSSQQEQ